MTTEEEIENLHAKPVDDTPPTMQANLQGGFAPEAENVRSGNVLRAAMKLEKRARELAQNPRSREAQIAVEAAILEYQEVSQ